MNRLFEALSEIEIELLTPAFAPQETGDSDAPSSSPEPQTELNLSLAGVPPEAAASDPPSAIVVAEEKMEEKEEADSTEGISTEIPVAENSPQDPVDQVEPAPLEAAAVPYELLFTDIPPAVAVPEESADETVSGSFPTEMLLLETLPPVPEPQSEFDQTDLHDLPRDVFPIDVFSLVLELRPEAEQNLLETIAIELRTPAPERPSEPIEPMVPAGPIKEELVKRDTPAKPAGPPAPTRVVLKVPPESRLVALTDPDSLGAEKFRALAARLERQLKPNEAKCFQVTSSVINEGKTLVSGNIAVTLAKHLSGKTLLVEGDLHRPTLAAIFGLERLRGLSHWWAGRDEELTPFVHKLEGLPLWFLPAGRPSDRPSEVLRSSRLSDAFANLVREFEWVVVDSTPMVPIVDVNLWSRLVDGTLLVVREGVTPVKALRKGLQALDHPNLIGMVLNDATASIDSKYDSQYYGSPKTKSDRLDKRKRRIFPI